MRRRRPWTLAQLGERASACAPTRCSSSDPRPGLSSSFDSGEPRCRSQIVVRMNSVNWRYSDCQFSSTAVPNADETT